MKFVALLFLLLSSTVFAGAESHGGGAFVCRDKWGELLPSDGFSVELQDIWEGKNYYGLPITRNSTQSWQDQLATALDRLSQWNSELYQKTFRVANYVDSHLVNIPTGTAIAAPHDAYSEVVKRNCGLEGIASFDEIRGDLLLDPTLVAGMPVTDYAALMMHESLYKVLREAGDTNSVRARHYTAFLFSSAPIVKEWQGVPDDALYCQTDDHSTAIALFKQDGHLWAQLDRAEGYRLLGVAKKEIDTKSSTTVPLFQQLFDGTVNQIGIQIGLNNYDSSELQEIFQIQSNYEKYVFVLGNSSKALALRCQSK